MFDNIKTYVPSPTLKRFHASSAFYRFVAGPVGSGKTAGAGCVEMALGALIQKPFPDKVRRVKFGVLRDTYRNLYSQFIPSWFEWFPRDMGRFVGSDDRPATHEFVMPDAPIFDAQGRVVDRGDCEITVEMKAMGANTVEQVARGWNLTGIFLDEMDNIPESSMGFLAGRVKRWPHKDYRVSKGVWGVFNKPDVDSWLYDWCVDSPRPDLDFFDQPGGLIEGTLETNPLAENLERLDDDYYQVQAKNNPPWYVRRMIYNKWGASVAGEVVYDSFNPDVHVATIEMEPAAGSEIFLGLDGGGTPAAVIMGRDALGRRIVYAEVVMWDPNDPKRRRLMTGVGPRRFAQAIKDALFPRFRGCSLTIGYGDPAMLYGADRENGEYSMIEIIANELGVPVVAAPSNEIELRLDAVRGLLYPAGRPPALIINPSCRMLRRGFSSDYKYEPRDPKAEGKRLRPQKTASSHVHDALQYGCLGDVGRAGVTAGAKYDRFQPKRGVEQAGWSMQNGILRPGGYGGNSSGTSYDAGFNVFDV